jgi:4-alpha-glucanotransferase
MKFPRRSGVLMHPTSFPGRFGIGDLGGAAYRFIDFLVSAGQYYWQVLPLSPTGYADSPYQGLSAFAGNPLLISPDKLLEAGYLTEADLTDVPGYPTERVDFGSVIPYKKTLLRKAFERFCTHASASQRKSFKRFSDEQSFWLEDFALFMALKEKNELRPWYEWELSIARHEPDAVAHWRALLADQIEYQKYQQWQFFEQWFALKRYANDSGIHIIGDIPIFVSGDSADVWANLHLFYFNKNLKPQVVAGVPPDYFSSTGQLWGNPLYRWEYMSKDGYAWWISRFRQALKLLDLARIDHFRGFYNYWEVPGGETTAVKGRWVKGPGADLFRSVTKELGDVAVIAEDLGDFTPESRAGVSALQEEFQFPGMKVLQFAFADGAEDPFLPHNFPKDCVVYTGTHDNDTCVGWYQNASEYERDHIRRYLAVSGEDIAWDLIRLGWASVATTAITTAQDLLNRGADARMNTPGTCGAPNWCWRAQEGELNEFVASRLRGLTELYGRL